LPAEPLPFAVVDGAVVVDGALVAGAGVDGAAGAGVAFGVEDFLFGWAFSFGQVRLRKAVTRPGRPCFMVLGASALRWCLATAASIVASSPATICCASTVGSTPFSFATSASDFPVRSSATRSLTFMLNFAAISATTALRSTGRWARRAVRFVLTWFWMAFAWFW